MTVTRLFDLPAYRAEIQPERAAFIAKYDGEWRKISPQKYIEQVNLLSYALLALGLQRGDKVALVSSDRPEWNYVDMASQQAGLVPVPVFPTISSSDYSFIFDNCEAKILFIDSFELLSKIKDIFQNLHCLEYVCLMKEDARFQSFVDTVGLKGFTFSQMMDKGRANAVPDKLNAIKESISSDDLATIIYTSGTSGSPKGVMLCHRNILTSINGVKMTPKPFYTRAMCFLPLCHIYERMMNYLYQFMGYEIYYAESIAKVADNMKIAKPYMMTAVPRFIEKMYDAIYRNGQKMKGLKKKIFFSSLDLAMKYDLEHNSWWFNVKRFFANKLVYSKIKENFGGCLEMFVSGGSAVQPRLVRFFTCVGMDIYEGYGMTEAAPVIAVSSALPHGRKPGTAGFPLPGTEVKILPDTGEIVCRGPHVMMGYYKSPELTAEVVDAEGWLHTGDTGVFEPQGQLRITGRTKTMFKTSMGKYVNPEVMEEKFKESPFILDMMVVGENQKFAAAIILPDFDFLKEWQVRHGIFCETHQEMLDDIQTQERYKRVVEKYNKLFGDTEQIKRYKIVNDTWTEANGCMTPTLKIKRKVIETRCAAEIESLFK